MSQITDWEDRYNRLFDINEDLKLQNQQLLYQNDAVAALHGKALTHIEDLLCELEKLKEQLAKSENFGNDKNSELIEYIKQFYEIKKENKELSQKNVSLLRDLKELQDKSTCFKADAITSLKAIDLCILATLCTEKQWLTHRARNFRMKHVHQIICNEVASFGDRNLITYEDDF